MDAQPQTQAKQLAATEGDECLDQLVTGTELARPGLMNATSRFSTLWLGDGEDTEQYGARDYQRDEVAQTDAGQEQQRAGRRGQNDDRSEIRFGQQQPHDQDEHEERTAEYAHIVP